MQSSSTGDIEPHEISLRPERSRIVLAEDDPDLRELLADLLRTEGHEVVEARSGTELRDLIESMVRRADGGRRVDLIISDVRMPGLTGLAALGGLRASDWNTPVILISGFADAETHLEAGRLGAVVLDKPLDVSALLSLARQHGSAA